MKQFFVVLTYVLSLLLAVMCGAFFVVKVLPSWHIAWRIVLFVALSVVGYVVAIYAHELGHKLVGMACGFKVKISPRVLFSPAASCTVIPQTYKHVGLKMFFIVLGGLVVNLALAELGCLGFHFPVVAYLLAVVPANFYLFMLNLLPFCYATGKTDGYVANEIINNSDEAQVMLAVITVQGMINSGVKMADIPEERLMNVPVIQEDDEAFISLTELRAEYYLAKGEEEKVQFYKTRLEQIYAEN